MIGQATINEVSNIYIPKNQIQNRIYWTLNRDGWFSTSLEYSYITQSKGLTNNNLNWIWKLDTYPKIKNLLRKIANNGLHIKTRLRMQCINVPQNCFFCPNTLEDFFHLFTKCPFILKNLHKINIHTANNTINTNKDDIASSTFITNIIQNMDSKLQIDYLPSGGVSSINAISLCLTLPRMKNYPTTLT